MLRHAGPHMRMSKTLIAVAVTLSPQWTSALVGAGGQDCAEFIFTNGFDRPDPVMAFATSYGYFYRFDILNPETVEVVSSSHITAFKLDFIGDDFSRAYGIDAFGVMFRTFAAIDTATGVITPIGISDPSADDDESLGNGRWSGFKYDNTSGIAYATANNCSIDSGHLYTIDMLTGASTVVGPLTGMGCGASAIAISATGAMYGLDRGSNTLFAIDKLTGITSPIGYTGFPTTYIHDIEFDDATGVLYYAGWNRETNIDDELRTFDLNTGETTLVGVIGTERQHIVGLAIETRACPEVTSS